MEVLHQEEPRLATVALGDTPHGTGRGRQEEGLEVAEEEKKACCRRRWRFAWRYSSMGRGHSAIPTRPSTDLLRKHQRSAGELAAAFDVSGQP